MGVVVPFRVVYAILGISYVLFVTNHATESTTVSETVRAHANSAPMRFAGEKRRTKRPRLNEFFF